MELLDKKGLTTVWAAIKNTFTSKSDADGKYAKKADLADYAKKGDAVNGARITATTDEVELEFIDVDGDPITYSYLPEVTTMEPGIMNPHDKLKLDEIAPFANNYKLPVASAIALGGIKTNYVPKSGGTLFKVNTDTEGNANTYIPGLIYGNDEYLSEIEFAADSNEHTSFDGKDFHLYDQEGVEKHTISLPDKDGTLALTSDCGLLVMNGDIVNNNIGFNGYKQNVLISASGNYNISNWYNSSPIGSVIDIYPFGEINGTITADNKYIFQMMGTSSSGVPMIVTKKSINLSNSHYIRLIHISDGVYVCVSVLGY